VILYLPSFTIDLGQVAQPFPFDEKAAQETALSLNRQHPDRAFGSESSHVAADWIAEQLKTAGLQFEKLEFESEVGNSKLRGINVAATLPGGEGPAVWILASYDNGPARGSLEDKASGVGVLIELARQMSKLKPRRSHRFIAVDGSEWGMLGARHLARTAVDNPFPPAVVLALDALANGAGKAIAVDTNGYSGGYSPGWLRSLAMRNLQNLGIPAERSNGFIEHTQRALDIALSAPAPFLVEKIPAIGIRNLRIAGRAQDSLESSKMDNSLGIETAGIAYCGLAVAGLVATIDNLEVLPSNPAAPLNLAGNYWVNLFWLKLAHWICFLPLAIAAFHAWHSTRVRLADTSAEPQWFSVAGCVLPLIAGYGCFYLFHAFGWMRQYESTPPPSQDPGAIPVEWIPIGASFIVALLVLGMVRLIRREREVVRENNLLAARTVGIVCLSFLSLAALIINSFWAFTFLLMPALIWPLLPEGAHFRREELDKRRAWILIPLSWLPILLVFLTAVTRLGTGWRTPWYLLLASVSGMMSPAVVVLGIILIGLSWRMVAVYATTGR
jgi:hypothetical protein